MIRDFGVRLFVVLTSGTFASGGCVHQEPRIYVVAARVDFQNHRRNQQNSIGAPGRTRTSTMLPLPDFESRVVCYNILLLHTILCLFVRMCNKLCKFPAFSHGFQSPQGAAERICDFSFRT